MSSQFRYLYFTYGILCSHVIFVARAYVARDMSCPDGKLHSLPASDERPLVIFMSIEDGNHLNVAPLCRLAVTVPQMVNMYQTMRLAQFQHEAVFNFSARTDDQTGFIMLHINGKHVRSRISDWILYDVDTEQRISKSITDVFMEDRKSYAWVYSRNSNIRDTYPGGCSSGTRFIRPDQTQYTSTMLYMSVQFWSNIWPLCKIPVLLLGYSKTNLNDLMLETKRQYKHLFVYQRYEDYLLYDINDLHSEGGYSWKAEIADSNADLNDVLYLVPLADGDHVIWRYIDGEGESRYKTVEPGVTLKMTPAVDHEKQDESAIADTHAMIDPGSNKSCSFAHISTFTILFASAVSHVLSL